MSTALPRLDVISIGARSSFTCSINGNSARRASLAVIATAISFQLVPNMAPDTGPIAPDVEDFAVTPEEYIGSGATVAAIVGYTGTGKATGKALDVPAVHVWDIRDGKLVRFRQFIDTVEFAEVVPAA